MVAIETIVQQILVGITQGGIYSLLAIGLTLILGVMGIVNLAQAEFMMLGMFLTFFAFDMFGVSPWISFFLLVPVMFVLGVVIQYTVINPVLDEPEDSQLVLTFGVLLVLSNAALLVWGTSNRLVSAGYSNTAFAVGPFSLNQAKTIGLAFALGAIGVTFYFLNRTKMGRAIRATADDDVLAEYAGINVERMYLVAFGIGTILTGCAGALIVTYFPVEPFVGLRFIIIMFVVVVLGGMGNVKGAAIAGFLVGIFEQVAILWIPFELQPALAFVLFLLVMLVRPEGIYGGYAGVHG